MKYTFYAFFFSLIFISCSAPELPPPPPPITIAEVEQRFEYFATLEFDEDRYDYISDFLDSLKFADQFPIIEDSTVLFVHFGFVKEVEWIGDFNNWGEDDSINSQGVQTGKSGLWTWKTTFPNDARFDYKISIDDELAIVDPFNRKKQRSESSENSVLEMPDWERDPIVYTRREVNRGDISGNQIIESSSLQQALRYWVYTPDGYTNMDELPVVYVTDGQAYTNNQIGNMPAILDNLIADGAIEPTIAVFIDSRDPNDRLYNLKGQLLSGNTDFANFLIEELVPLIDEQYKTSTSANDRAIMGTTLGGLNATYLAFTSPQTFGKVGSQSPAYWYKSDIYDIVENSSATGLSVFLSSGTYYDGIEDTQKMQALMSSKGHSVNLVTVNEGASWGAWRSQIDDILIQFFGK